MKRVIDIAKMVFLGFLGIVWGGISVGWLGYSLLTLTNVMEEKGSYDYMVKIL